MLKCLSAGFLILIAISLRAQQPDQFVFFTGQVLDPDSIPVENAYLISYRTLRAYSTNKDGRFGIQVEKGDSLKIHHVVFEPAILHPTSEFKTIVLKEAEYSIEAVNVKYRDLEMVYFNKNMETIKMQLAREYHFNFQSGFLRNPYAPIKGPTGIVELNLFEVIARIKRKLK